MVRKEAGGGRYERPKPGKSARELLSSVVPPQDLNAERAVLGSVLKDDSYLSDVVRMLTPDHFYDASHQKIYETMVAMFDGGHPIDVVTLGEALAKKEWLLEVGGAPTLVSLFEDTFTAVNVMHYARIVEERAIKRSLIHAGTEILRDAYESRDSAPELLASAEKRIFKILDSRQVGQVHEVRDVLVDAFVRINERQSGEGGSLSGVPTGFLDIDEKTNGWQNTQLIVLAARPSMGKTAMALNIVEAAAVDHELPVLFISLEMSEIELAERLLCARAEVNGELLRKGRLGSEEMQKLIGVSEAISAAPIYIDDTPGQTMLQIGATARRLKLRKGLKMIVVDYLQLIEADDRTVSRQEQISTISRRLKNLARELQVPVLALSQLNRSAENREGHRPRMSDLRESGSIEQDADVVMLLHRDDQYQAEENPGEALLIIAKQRNGPTGDVKLTFQKQYTRFRDFHTELAPFTGAASDF